jgi:flagellar basal body-associated protein FliL
MALLIYIISLILAFLAGAYAAMAVVSHRQNKWAKEFSPPPNAQNLKPGFVYWVHANCEVTRGSK